MQKNIPTYPLTNLASQDLETSGILFLNQQITAPKSTIYVPHRTNYFGIGICVSGKAELRANLETYTIYPNCLLVLSPALIRQWSFQSDDFETKAVLFTDRFINENDPYLTDSFPFFESVARHLFPLSQDQSEAVLQTIEILKQKNNTDYLYKDNVVYTLLKGLLYEVASLYQIYTDLTIAIQTRGQLLTIEFKKLVNTYCLTERSVRYYASKLFITPGHLTETVRESTGKTPHEWITEAVILEAKVLLQNPSLTITQVAQMLNFSDQSAFGKFFNHATHQSPTDKFCGSFPRFLPVLPFYQPFNTLLSFRFLFC